MRHYFSEPYKSTIIFHRKYKTEALFNQSAAMQKTKKLYLEFVRGGAAVFVLIAHIFELLPSTGGLAHANFIKVGTDAVMIFFILSGCVINISQSRNPKSKSEFLINRLLRLYPQFLIGILMAIAVIHLLKMAAPSHSDIFGNLFMVSSLQGYIVPSIETNSPVWSLSFEMGFYLLFMLTIGSYKKRLLWFWFVLSLLVLPLYYSYFSKIGVVNHIIAILSFSSIWLVGYFVYEYRNIFYTDTKTAVLSVALLPLISRLNIFSSSYDPFKYLLFAIAAAPFFRYCLQEKASGKKLNIIYPLIAYAVLVGTIFLNSESKFMSKVVYSALPTLLLALYYALKSLNLEHRATQFVNKTGAVTGRYSYSLYISHYPIVFFLSVAVKSDAVYLILSVILVCLVTYIFDNVWQPVVLRLFNRENKLTFKAETAFRNSIFREREKK